MRATKMPKNTTKMPAKMTVVYDWSESKVREINARLEEHNSEVRFHVVASDDPRAGINIAPRPKDAEEWHLVNKLVDQVLSSKS